jgi:hypothetical protein
MVYRNQLDCIYCNKPLIQKHIYKENFVGDTFVGYEECKCDKDIKSLRKRLGITQIKIDKFIK